MTLQEQQEVEKEQREWDENEFNEMYAHVTQ